MLSRLMASNGVRRRQMRRL